MHDKIIISALKTIQNDKPEEKEDRPLPSFFDSDNDLPRWKRTSSSSPRRPIQRMTRSKSRISAFVIPEVLSRRQTMNWGRRGASPGLPQATLLLYGYCQDC